MKTSEKIALLKANATRDKVAIAKVKAETTYEKEKRKKKPEGKLNKFLKSKAQYKKIFTKGKQVTVVENQPVYTKDRSRFFKETWEEEKRQLYFK